MSGVLRRLVRPLAVMAAMWAPACGGDGGTDPEPPPQSNRPPVASGSLPAQSMTVGESVTVNVAAPFSDPDGDALTYTANSSNAGVASVALSGTNLSITAVATGTATVTVTASDPAGLSASASANVTVMEPNRPPAALAPQIEPATLVVGDSVLQNVAPLFVDPDGDPLSYSVSSNNTNVVTVSLSGSVATARAVGVGTATVTITATDPAGLSTSISGMLTVEQANQPPVATVSSLPARTIQAGNSVDVDVSAFFSDPDGDALTYTASSLNTGIATVSVTGSTVTVTGVAAGMTTVTVTASDPGGLTASLSASVTVGQANRAPVATGSVPAQSLTVGQSVQVNVAPFFSDPDGDPLTYTASSSNTGIATASVTGSTVTVTGIAAGTATVSVTASDLGGLTASLSASVTVTVTASADREALVAFYDAAGGENWSRNDNWLTDAPLEDWYGVRVNRAGQVVSLDLAINNLRGRISPEIGNLSALETLNLRRNWRPGPSEIGLTGPIPKELGNLSNLNDIVLSSNELTGPIPSELGELANLARLDLGWNDLTGTIPDVLGKLTNLTDLDLAQNNLTGTIPPVIADLVSLTDLNLHGNGLRGEIPSALANLSLSSLDLSFNNLSGSIPTEFGNLTNLLSLFLRNNQLTGDIPSELGGLSRLLNLQLNYNKLTGPIPDSFLDLKLFSFFAENNESVCLPNTTDFATWLSNITQHDNPLLCGG